MADSPLVTTEWLAAHLDDTSLRIVDIRGHVIPASEPLPHYFNHREDYLKSHIPSAVFVDWVHEITDPDDPRHAQIAKPQRYAEVMSRLGIDENTFVVAYDDASSMFSARLWWSLHYYGHHRVAVLDGGWQKWIRENRPTTAEIPTIPPKQFTPRTNPALLRSGDEVQAVLSSATTIIDVRSPEEFAGKSSRAKRRGHIPGAVNLPRTDLVTPDGLVPSPEMLRVKFTQAGVGETSPQPIFYCNGGVSASYGLLALTVAGLHGTVYDGSWKDWGNDDSRPIE